MRQISDIFDERWGETDKWKFSNFYNFWMSKINPKIILEIGVYKGASLLTFQEYFPNAQVYGIDIAPIYHSNNVFIGDQTNTQFLDEVLNKIGSPDLIIDDGSHQWSHQIESFKYLFPFLNSKGMYIIEDLDTSYNPGFKNGDMSAIEYLKTLVDEINFHGKYASAEKCHDYPEDYELIGMEKELDFIYFGNSICIIGKR